MSESEWQQQRKGSDGRTSAGISCVDQQINIEGRGRGVGCSHVIKIMKDENYTDTTNRR